MILASASAARARLLEAAGLSFRRAAPVLDEAARRREFKALGLDGPAAARSLAEGKALEISRRYPEACVIGADQMLVCQGAWYEKPADLAAARAQLLRLRGRPHELHTAVALARAGSIRWHHVAIARLAMRDFSEPFLDQYLAAAGGEILGCVGAYQIEGLGAQLFSEVEGDAFAIQGLPLLPLLARLRQEKVMAA